MLRKLQIRPRPFYNTRHSYASFMLSIGAKMNFISAQTGDREETLRKHYAKYHREHRSAAGLDREADPTKVKNPLKKVKNRVLARSESEPAKMKKPSISQGLKDGAGEEGRTPDLMLGKHTL